VDAIMMADGRVLEYLEVGDRRGRPVVHLHGTPGTAGSASLFDDAARSGGVRLVAISRPGYGASTTTAPGLLSVGQDVGECASGLGIDEFAVCGISGGGPFALAVGAALPTRVRSILIAAGPGPYHQIAPEILEVEEIQALELLAAGDVDRAVAKVTTIVRRDLDAISRLSPNEFEEAFSALAPPTEHYFDTRPGDRATFYADVHRALARYDGYVRDTLSWSGAWDFDLRRVVAPVLLSYGDADSMVPPTHGEWLNAHLPTAKLVIHPDAAHGEACLGLAEWILSNVN
jgi:pimeloyl-ACP methyl ester carboxylesterase